MPPPIPKKPANIPEIKPVKNKRREITKKVSISNIINFLKNYLYYFEVIFSIKDFNR